MDEKRTDSRRAKTGGRRVTKTTTEYDWSVLERQAAQEKAKVQKPKPKTKRASEFEQKVRYQKQQKQQFQTLYQW